MGSADLLGHLADPLARIVYLPAARIWCALDGRCLDGVDLAGVDAAAVADLIGAGAVGTLYRFSGVRVLGLADAGVRALAARPENLGEQFRSVVRGCRWRGGLDRCAGGLTPAQIRAGNALRARFYDGLAAFDGVAPALDLEDLGLDALPSDHRTALAGVVCLDAALAALARAFCVHQQVAGERLAEALDHVVGRLS